MVEALVEKIEAHLPIREQRANWGRRHVKVALARLDIRAPGWNISRALQVLLRAHYEWRHHALPLEQWQYNVTISMASWHIDREF